MKRMFSIAILLSCAACSATSEEAPPEDQPSGIDAGARTDAGKDAGRDAGKDASVDAGVDAGVAPRDAGPVADTYVAPVVQDSGSVGPSTPDASTGGGSTNPLCSTFPSQCCTSLFDPACLDIAVVVLTQICCAP